MRFILSLIFLFSYFIGIAQNKYDVSAPINLPRTGVNKVLSMKNGNTMLFHFEPTKDISVVIFDSLHKEIANTKVSTRILDLYIIADAEFKGMYEINGEGVLFFDQAHLGKHRLIRVSINAQNGVLTDEKLVAESPSANKRTLFFVMKDKSDDGYAILFSTDIPQFRDCKVSLIYYSYKHEQLKEIPIDVARKKYDYMYIVHAESQSNGISISLCLSSLLENGTAHGVFSAAPVYEHYLAMYYIPKNSQSLMSTGAKLLNDTHPLYTNYSYNPFAQSLNLLVLSYYEVAYQNGLQWLPGALLQHIFFKVDENNMGVSYKWIRNKSASDLLKQKGDTSAFYEGIPLTVFTNENGLSTMVSESFSKYSEPETYARNNKYTYLGHIGITQFDDDGNELWGTVLPMKQRYISHRNYYPAYELSKKWQSQMLFADLPEAVYERQFVSINSYCHDKNYYIIFNDDNKNFNNSIEKPGDTVYTFENTNACYYKMNRKKEITKQYVFGEPASGEYKCSFAEGADFDEKRGVYVSLVQYKKGEDVSLRMAWSHLD